MEKRPAFLSCKIQHHDKAYPRINSYKFKKCDEEKTSYKLINTHISTITLKQNLSFRNCVFAEPMYYIASSRNLHLGLYYNCYIPLQLGAHMLLPNYNQTLLDYIRLFQAEIIIPNISPKLTCQ
jgi:hypothetical protein